MANKSLSYAENILNVHGVYEDANRLLNELDKIYGELDKAQDSRRQLVEEIADREMEILSDEWGKHSDMSAARMDQHIKVAKREDAALKAFREKLNERLAEIQGLEFDLDLTKSKLKVQTARLEQLGGYLHYLAAVKAESTNKTD